MACDSRESSKSICKEITLQRPKTGKFDYLSGLNHPAHSIALKFFTDDYGAEAPAGSVHKAPRGCSERGVAGARQFVIDGCRRRAFPYSNSGKRSFTGTVRGFGVGQALQT